MAHEFGHRTLLARPASLDDMADQINDANEEIHLCFNDGPNRTPKVWLEAPNCYTDPIYQQELDAMIDLLDQLLAELRE